MTTASDLIESTRGHLFTGQPENLNRLASGITAITETIPLSYDITGIGRGTIIEIGLEQIFVFVVDSSSKTVTACIRGYNGTTGAIGTTGDRVTVSPKFPRARVLTAINDDLADLSSPMNGLYRTLSVDLTFNAAVMGYDLTGVIGMMGISDLRYRTIGPEKSWPQINNYAVLRNMPTSDFASGSALVLYEGGSPGQTVRVTYQAPFTSLATLADDVLAISGLSATAHDIPPLGAAVRLAAGREVRRNFDEAQGEPRRAEEVPPQANAQATRELVRLRQQRIVAEQSRLLQRYGYEMVG